MRIVLTLCVALVAGAALGACSCPPKTGSSTAAAPAVQCAMCERGMKGESVWCDHCGHGFVAGAKVACKGCYAAKTGGPPCEACAAKK